MSVLRTSILICVVLFVAAVAGVAGVSATASGGAEANPSSVVQTGVPAELESSNSSTIIVDTTGETGSYTTMQEAIDVANDSDTIRIRPGTYTSTITVDKNVSIIAAEGVVLNGSTTSEGDSAITITRFAEPVISGFTITEFNTGVQAQGSLGAWTVTNTTIRNTTLGISASGTAGNWTVRGTKIVDSGREDFTTQAAIDAEWARGNWEIKQTTITDARYGVYAPRSSGEWSISRANISRTDLYAISAEESTGNWTVSTSILTQNYQSDRRISRSINGFDSVPEGDATGNWLGENGYSDNDCVGNVVCTTPLQEKPDAGVDSTSTDSTIHNITLSPETRFPAPNDPLSVEVNINATGPTGITWHVNGTATDCNSTNCTFDVSYPANITVSVSNAETTLQKSTVIRASDISLSATPEQKQKPVLLNESETITINISTRTSAIQHELLGRTWTVNNTVGTKIGDSDKPTTLIDTDQDGRIQSTLTYRLRDPETGETTTITKTEQIDVERLHTQKDQFTFEGLDLIWDEYGFAAAQDKFSKYHTQLSQRITPLPEDITIIVSTPEQLAAAGCPNAGACAVEPSTIRLSRALTRPWTTDGSGRTLRHELVHLAQFEMGADTSSEWAVLAEGHAEFDSGASYRHRQVLAEKPSVDNLKSFSSLEDYINGSVFVSAFYAEYGRQAFLELMRGSESESLETEFKTVTGDSLSSFYRRWQPTNPSEGPNAIRTKSPKSAISTKTMFAYQDGVLSALQPPEDRTIEWDTDNDGTFEYSGNTADWTPKSPGKKRVTLRYRSGNQSIAQTQILSVNTQTNLGQDASDPDNDGIYEDVNGDNRINSGDVQALFARLNQARNYPHKFDINGDGRVTTGDVQRLFTTI